MKRNYDCLDLVKVIMSIGIVAIHTNTIYFNVLGELGVPFFAISSSFLFFSKYLALKNYVEQRKRLLHFLKRILTLYGIWQIFYIPSVLIYLKKFIEHYGTNKGILMFLFQFWIRLPGQPLSDGWGQSWYLIGMLLMLPLYLFFMKYLGLIPTALLTFLTYIYYFDVNNGSFFYKWVNLFCKDIRIILIVFRSNPYLTLLMYILLGFLIAKFLNPNFSLKAIQIFCIITIILYIIEEFIVSQKTGIFNNAIIFMTVPTSLAIVLFSLKSRIKLKHSLILRKFSIFLYCIHMGVIHILKAIELNFRFSINSFLTLIVTVTISILIFWLLSLVSKNKTFRWMNILL